MPQDRKNYQNSNQSLLSLIEQQKQRASQLIEKQSSLTNLVENLQSRQVEVFQRERERQFMRSQQANAQLEQQIELRKKFIEAQNDPFRGLRALFDDSVKTEDDILREQKLLELQALKLNAVNASEAKTNELFVRQLEMQKQNLLNLSTLDSRQAQELFATIQQLGATAKTNYETQEKYLWENFTLNDLEQGYKTNDFYGTEPGVFEQVYYAKKLMVEKLKNERAQTKKNSREYVKLGLTRGRIIKELQLAKSRGTESIVLGNYAFTTQELQQRLDELTKKETESKAAARMALEPMQELARTAVDSQELRVRAINEPLSTETQYELTRLGSLSEKIAGLSNLAQTTKTDQERENVFAIIESARVPFMDQYNIAKTQIEKEILEQGYSKEASQAYSQYLLKGQTPMGTGANFAIEYVLKNPGANLEFQTPPHQRSAIRTFSAQVEKIFKELYPRQVNLADLEDEDGTKAFASMLAFIQTKKRSADTIFKDALDAKSSIKGFETRSAFEVEVLQNQAEYSLVSAINQIADGLEKEVPGLGTSLKFQMLARNGTELNPKIFDESSPTNMIQDVFNFLVGLQTKADKVQGADGVQYTNSFARFPLAESLQNLLLDQNFNENAAKTLKSGGAAWNIIFDRAFGQYGVQQIQSTIREFAARYDVTANVAEGRKAYSEIPRRRTNTNR